MGHGFKLVAHSEIVAMRHTAQTIAFVPTAVKAAKAYRGKRTEYRVREAKGGKAPLDLLVLDVRPNGERTWRVHYDVNHGGKRLRRKVRIGDGATALGTVRERWKTIKDAVDAKRDWVAEDDARRTADEQAAAGRVTFGDLAEKYMKQHSAKKKRTTRDDRNKLDRYILPKIGGRELSRIGKRDVLDILEAIAFREDNPAPVHADRVKTLLSSIFNWGVRNGHAEHNPAALVRAYSEKKRRMRVFSHEEIRALWPRLEPGQESITAWRALAVLRVAFLTGQRLSQISKARKEEFHGLGTKAAVWLIPQPRNKNKEILHAVPLPAMASVIISEAMALAGASEFVFPSERTGAPINRKTVYDAAMAECAAIGIEGATFHDTRRTLRTGLPKLSVDRDTRDRITGHKSGTANMSEWYDVDDYIAEMRAALERWEHRLRDIIDGREPGGNVVALRSA